MLNIQEYVRKQAEAAKAAFYEMSAINSEQKNTALLHLEQLIKQNAADILAANHADISAAIEKGLDASLLDRLKISEKTIESMCESVRQIASLPDPVGEMEAFRILPNGLQIGKMRVPLGVIGIIYESRPNVTLDAAALCLKSGNACILRGGSEALRSNTAIARIITQALKETGLPETAVVFIEQTDRAGVGTMLQSPDLIDVIIPRGGKSLVERISAEARVPVIKHLDGICHVYIDQSADVEKAISIAFNAKTSRYGTCNTMETLLIHEKRAAEILPLLAARYAEKGVELRGSPEVVGILPDIKTAEEADWHTEYLAPILSIKTVSSLEEAITHINTYGSHHTDSIITESYTDAQIFLRRVDSASVMVNASTRFADGFEYGLGAEIGISTDKIHARGPVGLQGLTSQKWIVLGNGQIRR